MTLEHCGLAPERAHTLAAALPLLERDGAVLIDGVGTEAEQARDLAFALFGERVLAVPPAARVFDGGEKDRRRPGIDHTTRLAAHTDGYGYGDLYPDYFLLECVRDARVGGESFLIDGFAVLDALADDPATAWVPAAMAAVAIDQSEADMQIAISPIVQRTPGGRRMLRKTQDQRPAAASDDPDRDREMIRIWHEAAERAVLAAPRFKLRSGQAVVVDNYRMLHGRHPYDDLDRLMWRVWVWTSGSLGVPDLPLHSDTRYAYAI